MKTEGSITGKRRSNHLFTLFLAFVGMAFILIPAIVRATVEVDSPDCDPTVNLVLNGSFETPVVTDSHNWDIYETGEADLEWTVEWMNVHLPFNGFSQPNPQLEIQAGVTGPAQDGDQFMEMDSDWNGPSSLFNVNGEPANTKVYQDIPTIVGNVYQARYYYSPRPNTPLASNHMKFYVDDIEKDDVNLAGGPTITWVEHVVSFTATASTAKIEFREEGTENSLGSYVDNVQVYCIQECDDDDDCNDGKECTQDECVQGICVNDPLPANTSCEDGDLCNGAEVCDGNGECLPGTQVVCDPPQECFNPGECQPNTGLCEYEPKIAGSSCADPNLCNGDEQCDGNGNCVAGTPTTCDDGNLCTQDDCIEGTGACDFVPLPGTPCPDGNLCDGTEICDAQGACVDGTDPVVCDDQNACTNDACVPANGTCTFTDNGTCGGDSGLSGEGDFGPDVGIGVPPGFEGSGTIVRGCSLNLSASPHAVDLKSMLVLIGCGVLSWLYLRRKSAR